MVESYSFRCQRSMSAIEDVIKKNRAQSSYFDLTIVTKDYKSVSANRLVLAFSSKYFQDILVNTPNHQPIILDEVCYDELSPILDFIYLGEAQLMPEGVQRFLELSKELELVGFEENVKAKDEEEYYEKTDLINLVEAVEAPENEEKAKNEDLTLDHSTYSVNMENHKAMILSHVEKIADLKFSCTLCGKIGKQKQNVANHVETHLNGFTISCPFCSMSFKSTNSMKMHKYVKHRDILFSGKL